MRPNGTHLPVLDGLASPPGHGLILALREREHRDRHALFLAEGPRFVHSAVSSEVPIAGLVTCPQLVASEATKPLIRSLRQLGTPTTVLSRERFLSLSQCADAGGIILVLRKRWSPLPGDLPPDALWLGLESIRTPGNLGTLFRSAVAAGADGAVVLDGSSAGVDPFDPCAVRASMGAIFGLRLMRCSHADLRSQGWRDQLQIFGATGEAKTDFRTAEYRGPTMIMLGDERKGLTPAQRRSCNHEVSIPMAHGLDSLNVAMAGTLMLFEAARQRHPPNLCPVE